MSAPELVGDGSLRVGQRVRVTRVVEGEVSEVHQDAFRITMDDKVWWWFTDSRGSASLTVEVLAEPRPPEPTGLGAVVRDANGTAWVRASGWATDLPWVARPLNDRIPRLRKWADIPDPVVLSEGWAEQ